jgi:SM-20-related protein
MQQLNSLRIFLNRENYLGLNDLELHAAIYPENSFYKKHRDNFKNSNQRIVSVILYLNIDWNSNDGGQLRLYLPKKSIDIEPIGGRLVVFLSEDFPHEVLTTHQERYSLTGWFRRNELPL